MMAMMTDVLPPVATALRDPQGRRLPGVVQPSAEPWKKGSNPRPPGRSGDCHAIRWLARQYSPSAVARERHQENILPVIA
jgi:hypothetical protein